MLQFTVFMITAILASAAVTALLGSVIALMQRRSKPTRQAGQYPAGAKVKAI